MRTNGRILVLALVVALAPAGVVLAQGPGDGPPGGSGPQARMHGGNPAAAALGPVGRALRELDLSEEQRAAIRGVVRTAMEGELGKALQDHRAARREVDRLVWASRTDEGALLAALQRSTEVHETLALARVDLARSVRAELSEEQNARLDELLANLPDEPAPYRQRGQRRGGRS